MVPVPVGPDYSFYGRWWNVVVEKDFGDVFFYGYVPEAVDEVGGDFRWESLPVFADAEVEEEAAGGRVGGRTGVCDEEGVGWAVECVVPFYGRCEEGFYYNVGDV